MQLTDFLPDPEHGEEIEPVLLYDRFVEWADQRGIQLYPAQDEAITEVMDAKNVIMATPTGSGKSMVALAAHFYSLARGETSYYTAPIKALVSEKFFDLIEIFGAEHVGMVTGDSAINPDAPIICCTAEILAIHALREGSGLAIGSVVMDEFHFYADPQRGWAWQVPLLELPQAQFVLMSATLGDTSGFEASLTERTRRQTITVSSTTRPIPLYFEYSEIPVQQQVEALVQADLAPVYIVHFSQLDAVEQASNLASLSVTSRHEKDRIAEIIKDFRFASGFGKSLNRLIRQGIGVHHAGMLPKYRRLVERLAQQGLLKVISGTDTLGVGINVPIRTVLMTGLSKFDGTRQRHLNAREFHQIAGRAGRAGFDTAGTVVVQAPEHIIENQLAQQKATEKFASIKNEDERARRIAQSTKSQPKKTPPKGFVSWSKATFDKLVSAQPEPMMSRMRITHSMLLNILARPGNPITAVRRMILRSAETKAAKAQLQRRAIGILRELLVTDVVVAHDTPDEWGNRLELTVDLQADFALNQPLSPFALAAFELLDPNSPSYAVDMVSIIEATLEPPRQVLTAQLRKLRDEEMARMRADGLEYNERMNVLDNLTYPQPLGELLNQQFELYRQGAPWLAEFELQPKSVVRDMYERAMGFGDYVNYYGIARSEGVLLRYLTDAAKALRQTIPQELRTEELDLLQQWLETIIITTDSSLLEEWENMLTDDVDQLIADHEAITPPEAPKLTETTAVFTVMVRNAMFHRVQLFGDEQDARLESLDYLPDGAVPFTSDNWADALDDFFDQYEDLDDSPTARAPEFFRIDTRPGLSAAELADVGATAGDYWLVSQVLVDPNGNHDFAINAVVHLEASNEQGSPAVTILSVGTPAI
ncbi:MAG TPA: DUF3516 domain-containing protein [Candidatus Yaniella excrementigallinarum]|nr:DUF3516 domain-containing protein [Candidatus Yaniella excrementigallinarum]